MVPDPRSWIRAPIRAFRASRVLALALGVAAGIGAVSAAIRYAHPSLYEYLLLPLGVGGTVYYVAHHETANWSGDVTSRESVRLTAMMFLATAYASNDVAIRTYVVEFATASSVLMLVMVSTAVAVSEDRATDDDPQPPRRDADTQDGAAMNAD